MPNNQEVSLHVKAIDNNGNEFQIPFNELSVMKGSAFKNIDELYLISKTEDLKKTYSLYEDDLGKDEYETRQIPNENNQSVDSRINLDNINGRQYIDRFFELQSNLYQKQNMYKDLEIDKLKKDDSVSEMYITQKSKELEKESVINNRKINGAKSFIKTEKPNFDPFLEDNLNNVKIVEELNQDLSKSNQKDFSNNMDYKNESLNNNNEQNFIENNGNVIQEKENQTNNLNQNNKDFENITSKETTQENENESRLNKELEMNRKFPNNPYGTIEDFISKKSYDENLYDAQKKMDNLNLNYKDSVEFYNKVSNEMEIESDRIEQTDTYKNANGEQQSYQKSAVVNKVEKENGIKENSNYKLKDVLELYAIKNSDNQLSKEIENYQPNNIQDNKLSVDTSKELQKLKSVEVEKNVIGLLPKEQQENNFNETLSRLDKNKSSLKDNLKNYMSNEKIDNAINSVKQHFDNIKVKAEDVQQTFKDLGQWNTENKFVKDIDNVINSVKDLGKKHENELLQSDSNSIMSKLNNEYLELKEFVNKAEQDNNVFKEEQNIRSEFVSKMLNAKQIEIDFDPKEVTKDLSENQKLEVYNHLKDLNHHYQNNANTTSLVKEQENKVIIKNLEEDNPEFINKRQEHVTLKQSLQPIKIETTNEKLDSIIKESNIDIKKMDGLDKKNFKESKNQEKTITNQNAHANKIKSNDMFKKMEKLNQQAINENTEKKEPKISRQSMTR
ncbi:hypothetical protein M4L39_13555 [Staphylococcus equorum]|uniref:hypothetical protein n=1 Tax=Staphylococcus equorum TaxID=246432 RepID=UPI00240856F4|nr:hypothetical protein [Staphylococcus equorum]MDG0844439.1 hypothetical protein [Staphylococcus equorum]